MSNLHLHRSVIIHTSADQSISRLLLHRDTLSGQHGFIHTAAAACHNTVQGYPAARFNQEMLAYSHAGRLHFPFRAILIENRCIRGQFHQLSDRLGGLSLTSALHVFAQHDECDDDCRRLVIEMMGIHWI